MGMIGSNWVFKKKKKSWYEKIGPGEYFDFLGDRFIKIKKKRKGTRKGQVRKTARRAYEK
jgi:hypothetical protein